jgi:hypothetical protein
MLSFLADENFNGVVLRGLLLRLPTLDIVRVQDLEIAGFKDPPVLEWAAAQTRILLTHDVRTIPRYAYDRVRAGMPMPGVIAVARDLPIGWIIAELLIIALCGVPEDFEGQVHFL